MLSKEEISCLELTTNSDAHKIENSLRLKLKFHHLLLIDTQLLTANMDHLSKRRGTSLRLNRLVGHLFSLASSLTISKTPEEYKDLRGGGKSLELIGNSQKGLTLRSTEG